MKVIVLCGGPDAEAPVSVRSGRAVADALMQAGHEVLLQQIEGTTRDLPDGDVIFPVLHGPWGEGGPLQALLEGSALPFVGCASDAAKLCMDKAALKQVARTAGLSTPDWQLVDANTPSIDVPAPVVVKPVDEGSSVGLFMCDTHTEALDAVRQLTAVHDRVLVEACVRGREITIGLLQGEALPAVEIKPASGVYDYAAKYERDDTAYVVQPELPAPLAEACRVTAEAIGAACGVRDLARVDLLVDDATAWLLEVNTMPGFTASSLYPMAAAAAHLPMPALCDRLVRAAVDR